ncbi:MAG TPA: ABC transporter ATP-binding protein [bacterium]|nr:ABC transporter ATP-binding protein [bacterium]
MKLLEIKNIYKNFSNKKVLHGINLDIENGEISSIFGYSGEGKSTLLKIICGIIKQDSGDIVLNEKNINNLEPYERSTTLVMDEPLLFPHMNVLENIAFGSKLRANKKRHTTSNKKALESPKEIMGLLGITGLEKRYPSEISMGQAQRVSLARALIVNPEIILMDEPFSNLDIISKTKVRKLIKEINCELKISILLVTHDIEDVINLSNKMFILNKGEIKDSGRPKDVLKKPSSIETAFLIGTENIFDGIISEIDKKNNIVKIRLKNEKPENIYIEADYYGTFKVNERIVFAIRPEEVMILREDRGASRSVRENHFTGKIISSVFTLRMMEILIKSESGLEFKALIPFHAYEVMHLFEGKTINISLKKSAIHIIEKKKR